MEPTNIPIHPEIARDRQPGDIDLVTETHSRLKAAQWNQADAWLDHPEIVRAKDAPPVLQRLLIARNLQDPFLGLPLDTRAERIRLNGTEDPQEFLQAIEEHIAPALHNLEPLHAELELRAQAQRDEHARRLAEAATAVVDDTPHN
jgi:hypothetical protein